MIVSKTPLRVSFAGGGTDFKDYYEKGYGAVVSSTIRKYIYVIINENFDDAIHLSYSNTENVDDVNDLKHELVREALKLVGITRGIEIAIISDVPPQGTGLGSSSSLTVGLLNALYAYKGVMKPAAGLAEEACKIEIEILGKPIGKQDQYIAAYGGLKYIQFNHDESVFVNPIICPPEAKKEFESRVLMFYTGLTRKASDVLTNQKENIGTNIEFLDRMKNLASQIRDLIVQQKLDDIGAMLHENWMLKKRLAENISNPLIDEYYKKAKDAGALGGKVLGAGGGGFLLVYARRKDHPNIRHALPDLREMPFRMEPHGSRIIYIED